MSDPVFPDAPMIRRLRASEEKRWHVVTPFLHGNPFVNSELRNRLDKIVENHPFMEGAP